ncbi:hypothetical protein AAY473_002701 [Plecturocebus cupreus]
MWNEEGQLDSAPQRSLGICGEVRLPRHPPQSWYMEGYAYEYSLSKMVPGHKLYPGEVLGLPPKLQYSDTNIAHCSLELLGSNDPPTLDSQVAGATGATNQHRKNTIPQTCKGNIPSSHQPCHFSPVPQASKHFSAHHKPDTMPGTEDTEVNKISLAPGSSGPSRDNRHKHHSY